MSQFDPIASQTVRTADNLEPSFVHGAQVEVAKRKLADHLARRKKRPNVLIFMMDDVGLGRLRLLRRRRRRRRADAELRQARARAACYSRPAIPSRRCSPSRATLMTGRVPNRHGLHRPPMYGEPGGLQGEMTVAQLLSDAGYVTQAVGKWHLGENVESQPQNVGFDDFYGFLSVSDMYTEWRDAALLPRDRLLGGAHRVDQEHAVQQVLRARQEGRRERERRRGDDPCPVAARREVVPTTRSISSSAWPRATSPWLLYHCTRGAHFDNYPHERFLGKSPARHPYKDTLIELDDIMGRLLEALREDRASSRTR